VEALVAISPDLVSGLHRATVEGDVEGISSLVERIADLDSELGRRLAELARDFDHDAILALVRQAR
jgi:hypothetical protein